MAFGFGIGKNKVLVYSVDEFSAQVNGIVDPKLAAKQDKQITRSVTLAGGSSWALTQPGNMYQQIADVLGVTASNTVFVSPDPSDQTKYAAYISNGIYAVAQLNDKIVFVAKTRPTTNLTVNVVILGV